MEGNEDVPVDSIKLCEKIISSVNLSVNKIEKILIGLKPDKACGYDNISNRVLKGAAHGLSHQLSIIFQHSMATGKCPVTGK